MDISELLLFTHKEGASDLHISAGEPPMVRIHGEMKRIEMPPLTREELHVMLYDVLSDQQRKKIRGDARIGLFSGVERHRPFPGKCLPASRGEKPSSFGSFPQKFDAWNNWVYPKSSGKSDRTNEV